ncbi:unnamed protein product [Sphagnum jensenii]|uniref:Uncharacterized protein n=1 Tax=Sphagnum jensenii TaxID=128206 RepID=A0ABP0WV07_9BRYO
MWKALLGTCRIPGCYRPPSNFTRLVILSSNYISEVPLLVLYQLLGAVVALIHMEKLSQLMEILALAKIFCLRIIARMRQMSRYAV